MLNLYVETGKEVNYNINMKLVLGTTTASIKLSNVSDV